MAIIALADAVSEKAEDADSAAVEVGVVARVVFAVKDSDVIPVSVCAIDCTAEKENAVEPDINIDRLLSRLESGDVDADEENAADSVDMTVAYADKEGLEEVRGDSDPCSDGEAEALDAVDMVSASVGELEPLPSAVNVPLGESDPPARLADPDGDCDPEPVLQSDDSTLTDAVALPGIPVVEAAVDRVPIALTVADTDDSTLWLRV